MSIIIYHINNESSFTKEVTQAKLEKMMKVFNAFWRRYKKMDKREGNFAEGEEV